MTVTGSNLDIYSWSGTLLKSFLPKKLVLVADASKKANLNFDCFSYFEHYNDIQLHSDGIMESRWAEQPFENPSRKICNLNYIVSSADSKAYTYMIDNETGEKKSYLSNPGTAILMDPRAPHGIVNNGYREIIQMRWLSPIEEVKQFLEQYQF